MRRRAWAYKITLAHEAMQVHTESAREVKVDWWNRTTTSAAAVEGSYFLAGNQL